MKPDAEGAGEDCDDPELGAAPGLSAALNQLDSALRAVQAAIADRRAQSAQMAITAEQVRAVIERRQRRSLIFPASLFSDPGWDLLLELYACALERRSPSIVELTLAVGVPGTTILRWLGMLESQALLTRRDDPRDTRKVRIGLSEYGKSQMDRYFADGADYFFG